MDKNMHQGHEPEHVDLTQIEDEPSTRVDPLFERQTDDTEFVGPWFGARFYSDTPVRSPAGTAAALLKVVLAAGLPAAGLAAGGWAMGVAGWLTLTLAALMFMAVGTVGLFLLLRAERSTHAPHAITSNDSEEQNGSTKPRTDCGETHERSSRHPIEHPQLTRAHRALQPPRRK
jgi:hypothetical protein